MRNWLVILAVILLLAACGPAPQPAAPPDKREAEETRFFRTPVAGTQGGLVTRAATVPDATPEPLEIAGDPFAALEETAMAQGVDPAATATRQPTPTPETPPTVDGVTAATTSPAAAEVRARDYVKGADAESAVVTIIEYSDFECPACATFTPVLAQLLADFPDSVRLVYRHNPLTEIHRNAQKAAEAAEAAGAQGQFWPYHDALYARQGDFAGASADAARAVFIAIAGDVGLDVEQFTADLDGGAFADYVGLHSYEARRLRLDSTPSLLVNGTPVAGAGLPFDYGIWQNFVSGAVAEAELARRQYDAPPPLTIDSAKQYRATVEMASGATFTIELLPASAPQTVNSFVFLAREGWFDGVTFHRVLPGFVAQTGDPSGTGRGGPGYMLPNEIDPALSHAAAGMVAMANSGPDTNGSQWYVTLGDASYLDGNYTIFGRVTDGLDVVQQLTPRDPRQDPGAPPGDVIARITIFEQ